MDMAPSAIPNHEAALAAVSVPSPHPVPGGRGERYNVARCFTLTEFHSSCEESGKNAEASFPAS